MWKLSVCVLRRENPDAEDEQEEEEDKEEEKEVSYNFFKEKLCFKIL